MTDSGRSWGLYRHRNDPALILFARPKAGDEGSVEIRAATRAPEGEGAVAYEDHRYRPAPYDGGTMPAGRFYGGPQEGSLYEYTGEEYAPRRRVRALRDEL